MSEGGIEKGLCTHLGMSRTGIRTIYKAAETLEIGLRKLSELMMPLQCQCLPRRMLAQGHHRRIAPCSRLNMVNKTIRIIRHCFSHELMVLPRLYRGMSTAIPREREEILSNKEGRNDDLGGCNKKEIP